MWWLIRIWLPLALAITGTSALSYAVAQQIYGNALNDPQIQMAEDTALRIAANAKPADLVEKEKINISRSLAPFTIIYNEAGEPVAWDGELEEKAPVPPRAIFEYASGRGEYRVIWQPDQATRIAAVVERVAGEKGYVLSGRNTREHDERMWELLLLVSGFWMATLLVSLFASWLGARATSNRQ